MLQICLNRVICSTVVVLASKKYRKGCTRLNVNHPTSFPPESLIMGFPTYLCQLDSLNRVWLEQLPTLHCTCYRIHAWAIRRPWLTFVNALANSLLGRFYIARTQRFASLVWPMVLWKLGNMWKWKGEAWFHCTKVLFVGVVGNAEMWFYLV